MQDIFYFSLFIILVKYDNYKNGNDLKQVSVYCSFSYFETMLATYMCGPTVKCFILFSNKSF